MPAVSNSTIPTPTLPVPSPSLPRLVESWDLLEWNGAKAETFHGHGVYLADPGWGNNVHGLNWWHDKAGKGDRDFMNGCVAAAPLVHGNSYPPNKYPHATKNASVVIDWELDYELGYWPDPVGDFEEALEANGVAVDRVMARAHMLHRWDLLPGWYARVWSERANFRAIDGTPAKGDGFDTLTTSEAPSGAKYTNKVPAINLDEFTSFEGFAAIADLAESTRTSASWQDRAWLWFDQFVKWSGQLGFSRTRGLAPPLWYRPHVTYRPHWWCLDNATFDKLKKRAAEIRSTFPDYWAVVAAYPEPTLSTNSPNFGAWALSKGADWYCDKWTGNLTLEQQSNWDSIPCDNSPAPGVGEGDWYWSSDAWPKYGLANDELANEWFDLWGIAWARAAAEYVTDGLGVVEPYAAWGHKRAENDLTSDWTDYVGVAFALVTSAVFTAGAGTALIGAFGGAAFAGTATGTALASSLSSALNSGLLAETFGGDFLDGFGAVFDNPEELILSLAGGALSDLT